MCSLHDAMPAERLGVPSDGVMTGSVVCAAELMVRVLGVDGHDFSVIDHPVSSATSDQLLVWTGMTVTDIHRTLGRHDGPVTP